MNRKPKCSFSQDDHYPGAQVCSTDGLRDIRLKVVETGEYVTLILCPEHRLGIFDKALAGKHR